MRIRNRKRRSAAHRHAREWNAGFFQPPQRERVGISSSLYTYLTHHSSDGCCAMHDFRKGIDFTVSNG